MKRRRADQTGLVLDGRKADGRYVYQSVSVLRQNNTVALTHEARVGLAVCSRLARSVRSFTVVYPMTRQTRALGYGVQGGCLLWIQRPVLAEVGRLFLNGHPPNRGALSTLVHELGHNIQPCDTTAHGAAFRECHVEMMGKMTKATKGYRVWPKLDMRKLRDSIPKRIHKRKRAGK